MAKGSRKHAKTGCFFQIRNKCSPQGKKSENKPSIDAAVTGNQNLKESKGSNSIINHGTGCQLRPRTPRNSNSTISGNRIVNINMMIKLINSLYKTHKSIKEKCAILNIEIVKEVKQGLAWKFQFRCKNCGFLSQIYSMFSAIPNSKGAAAINAHLAMAVMDTSMGITKARLFFYCT